MLWEDQRRSADDTSLEVVQYDHAYRLCHIRGPEGLLIGLAEELESSAQATDS